MKAVVLLSGGMDSAVTLARALHEGRRAHALTLAYGQRHAVEIDRARAVAARLGATSHRVVDLDLSFLAGSALTDPSVAVPTDRAGPAGGGIPATYVPARNTVLLALALAWAESIKAPEIWLGVNAVDYSGYPDCRPEFLEAFERAANLGTRDGVKGRPFAIVAPLIGFTKRQIVLEAIRLGVDLATTVSCYDPSADGGPCRRCDACRLRAKGFAEAGLDDPALAGD